MRDRVVLSTRGRPTVSDEGRPFVDPPWEAALDVEAAIGAIPMSATISGMFFTFLVEGAKQQGITLPSARPRYVQFTFYPLADLARLVVEACGLLFPGRTLRHGLRTLGRSSHNAFLQSTLGKVTLGSTEGVAAALAAMASGYELNLRPSRVATLDSASGWAVVRLEKVVYFLDSHHVGVFEGLLRFSGVRGSVQIANRSPASADFLLTWDASSKP